MLSRPEKTIAVDCEMVGVGDGRQSQLARVSIVDFNGVVMLDTFVSPTMQVVDYRTSISGVRKSDLDNGNAT
jgi:RNA exonuclease 4